MSKSHAASPGLVSPSEHANTAFGSDIRQVGGLDIQKYGQEAIFEADNMSKSPPAAPRLVPPSQNANITPQ